jgi:hypothetical protein
MKPRRQLLVISSREETLSLRTYLLHNAEFEVFTATTAEGALAQMTPAISAVIGDGPSLLPWPELTAALKKSCPGYPLAIVLTEYDGPSHADVVLNDQSLGNAVLVETVRTLAKRRRHKFKPPEKETA